MNQDDFKKIRESFFNTTFILLGHIANCDGYVNRDELKRTKTYMDKMQLSEYCRNKAIRLFRTGASPLFDMADTLEEFKESVEKSPRITEVLLVYLISIARVDGMLVEKEQKLIQRIATILGYTSIIFEHMLKMISAQENIYNSSKQSTNNKQSFESKNDNSRDNKSKDKKTKDENSREQSNASAKMSPAELLSSAYNALGIAVGSDKTEVKKAYRKLINQYHPDKVQGQGLPPEFINAATEYFKRIQFAYEYINSH